MLSNTLKVGFAATLAIILAGCQTATVADPVVSKYGGADADSQLEFWHQLADKPITCNDDAFHGLLLYLDGQDPNADYAARVNSLKSRGLLPSGFDKPANKSVTRGDLAIAISRALQIKGGLFLHVLPDSPRYATRELMYMDLYPVSSPNQTFSGNEFLGIMGRVEDWQRGNSGDVPASVMPDETK